MTSKALRISAVALTLVASSPALAQQTATEPGATAPTATEQNDGFDWGWLGLLGLLGLAGLSGRRRDHPTTTTRR